MSSPVVLVTGGSKRTGRVIAESFAALGYDIVVHYNTSIVEADATVKALAVNGRRAVAIGADLGDESQIRSLVGRVYEQFDRLDVLVNCASSYFQDNLEDFRVDNLDLAWRINCRAPILLTQAFYQHAKSRGQTGAVVNIVDQKVRDNFHPDDFSYTVGKVGIGYMTKMLAVSAMGVLRVNAVYPGLMSQSGDQTPEDFAYASKVSNLLGYVAGPEDLANAVVLLATVQSFVGTDFVVDAGQNLIPVTNDVVTLHRAPR
ncbi:SDR family oxidoreductase [Massilia sp. CCM 8734]|uniref:SDR family oxidoreductase n=1 Tax=Massilia sp. CCM 8734 TaxID=2609283 RepID=UPI001423BB5B|nr:SDR family oxidoreductase [Massilia sp. CCM 8734]NHZ99071.1 SDR family oxidoreductase [Massilia sp. CCM 8734]